MLPRPGLWSAAPAAPAAAPAAASQAAARYQSEQVGSATPAELTGMLFTAALGRMDTARELLEAGKPGEANPHLVKAQDIVDELRSSLDLSTGDLAVALDGVYSWVLQQLVSACVKADLAALAEARRCLEPIGQAWREAVLKQGAPS